MKRTILKSMMAVLGALLSINVHAYDVQVNGIYYNLNTNNKTATVTSGSTKYAGYVNIPSSFNDNGDTYSVTSIGYGAFKYCYDLTSVNIPSTVKSIGESAFYNCTSLNSIIIPNGVTYIDYAAFEGCSSLNSINISSNVKIIGNEAFANTPWYDNQPNGLVYINSVAYKYKGTMPSNTSITIKDGTTSISHGAFMFCDGLTSLTVPNTVTFIGGFAFEGTTWYNNKENGLIYINNVAYQYKGTMPENTSITIKEGTVSISPSAFSGCGYRLASVAIPNSVTYIGYNAFYGCKSLTSVNIPSSVSSIDYLAFGSCSGLTSVVLEVVEPFIFGKAAFNNIASTCTLTVPYGTKDAYIAAGWTEDVFKGGIVEAPAPSPNITFADANVKALCVANWDTNGDGELNEVEAAAVTDLGTIFKNNKQITSFDELQYFTGLTSIGTGAFYLCNGLRSVIIPNNVTSINQYGFCDCSSLTSVTFSNNVTSIGDRAFQGCSGLTTISIPNSVTSIGYAAFSGCSSLTTVSIPNNVTSIVTETFDGCSGLTSVSIPNGVTSIGNSAFRDCSGLTSVTIPNSVTSIIGSYAFKNCTNLTSVISEIEEPSDFNIYAFQNISSTCTLTVPYGTKDAYFDKGWSESVFKGGIVELDNRNEQSMELASLPAKTYGDASYTLPATTTEGLALVWTSSNTNVATISGNTLTMKGAGTAAITATQAGNDDYKPFSKEFTLTVAKAPLTITANDAIKNVGEANPAFTASYEGFVGEDDASVLTTQPSFTCEATSESPVGTYDINVSGAEAANYEMAYVKGTLTVVDTSTMNDMLVLANAEICRGKSVVLPVNMDNEDAITAMQFDLVLPNSVTIAKNAKGKYIVEKTERCKDHTLSVSKPDENVNTYKVLLYSNDVEEIVGNNGVVLNITLEAAENMAEGDYEIHLKNINLTKPDETKLKPTDAVCTLTVRKSVPGDVNGDNEIDVTDIVGIANYILGRPGESFDIVAADVNGDNEVDVTDIVAVANIILHGNKQNGAKVRAKVEQLLDPQ